MRVSVFLPVCLTSLLLGGAQGSLALRAQVVHPNAGPQSGQWTAISQTPINLVAQIRETEPQQPLSKSSLWASSFLARLIEQHECKAKLSDANQVIESINRLKVAAQLFSCLENWNKQTFNPQEQEDLQTLLTEFKLELVALNDSSIAEPLLSSAHLSNASALTSIGSSYKSEAIAFRSATSRILGDPSSRHTVKFSNHPLAQVSLSVSFSNQSTTSGEDFDVNAEANVGKLGLFGRYGKTPTEVSRSGSTQAWTAGIGLRGFIVPHSLLALSARRVEELESLTQPVQMSYGAFYQFPLTERLTILPSIVLKPHPKNVDQNLDVQGSLQATFSF